MNLGNACLGQEKKGVGACEGLLAHCQALLIFILRKH